MSDILLTFVTTLSTLVILRKERKEYIFLVDSRERNDRICVVNVLLSENIVIRTVSTRNIDLIEAVRKLKRSGFCQFQLS